MRANSGHCNSYYSVPSPAVPAVAVAVAVTYVQRYWGNAAPCRGPLPAGPRKEKLSSSLVLASVSVGTGPGDNTG